MTLILDREKKAIRRFWPWPESILGLSVIPSSRDYGPVEKSVDGVGYNEGRANRAM